MAAINEWDEKQNAEWERWLADNPEVSEVARRTPPNRMYRQKSTGLRVVIRSYGEDGTVRVLVSGRYNVVEFDREVFGVEAGDLEECEMPEPGEPVGTILTDKKDILACIERRKKRLAAGNN